jgi:hypothetical protein
MSPPELPCATRELCFRDARTPREIRGALEREFMTPLQTRMDEGALECHGAASVNGATCGIALRFVAAAPGSNAYWLRLTLSWAGLPVEHQTYHQRTAGSWFDLWTRDLEPGTPAEPERSDAYERLAADALAEDAGLSHMDAVQRHVLQALREGACFRTAHKEGGSVISWRGGRFVRQDYGESDARETFAEEAAFLAFLRRFYDWETQRGIPGGAPGELERWRLIARLLRRD